MPLVRYVAKFSLFQITIDIQSVSSCTCFLHPPPAFRQGSLCSHCAQPLNSPLRSKYSTASSDQEGPPLARSPVKKRRDIVPGTRLRLRNLQELRDVIVTPATTVRSTLPPVDMQLRR